MQTWSIARDEMVGTEVIISRQTEEDLSVDRNEAVTKLVFAMIVTHT